MGICRVLESCGGGCNFLSVVVDFHCFLEGPRASTISKGYAELTERDKKSSYSYLN